MGMGTYSFKLKSLGFLWCGWELVSVHHLLRIQDGGRTFTSNLESCTVFKTHNNVKDVELFIKKWQNRKRAVCVKEENLPGKDMRADSDDLYP